jgi:hypothetical protein
MQIFMIHPGVPGAIFAPAGLYFWGNKWPPKTELRLSVLWVCSSPRISALRVTIPARNRVLQV